MKSDNEINKIRDDLCPANLHWRKECDDDQFKCGAKLSWKEGFDAAAKLMKDEALWKFCPECGCESYRNIYAEELQCMECGQSWFRSSDYSEVIQKYLSQRLALRQELADYREALEFYGDLERWESTTSDSTRDGIGCGDFQTYMAGINGPVQVGGKTARECLAKHKDGISE